MRAKVDYYFGCAVRHFGGVLCGVVKSVVFCVVLAVWCTRASTPAEARQAVTPAEARQFAEDCPSACNREEMVHCHTSTVASSMIMFYHD